MSGHSKWSNIKHKKSTKDIKKGKKFTRLIRDISLAAKKGLNQDGNPSLRSAIAKALEHNMTKNIIQRILAKNNESLSQNTIYYEAYACGVVFLLCCKDNNKNRVTSKIRYILSETGGKLGYSSTTHHIFERKGLIICKDVVDVEELLKFSIDQNMSDIDFNLVRKEMYLRCKHEKLEILVNLLKTRLNFSISLDSKIVFESLHKVSLNGKNIAKVQKIFQSFKKLDDVIEIYTNLDDSSYREIV